MVININSAEYIEGYKIQFQFSDGINRLVDFESFLKGSKNPMTRKYLDIEQFRCYILEHGDIVWNDYEMCFPVWDLHEGTI